MKRLHINVSVGENDLDDAIRFYGALFNAEPDVHKNDYARFRIDEPCVNFSISARGGKVGVDHLGIDVDSDEELNAVTENLKAAGHAASEPKDGVCCYAQSKKSWSVDPAGVPWETFHTTGSTVVYGTDKRDNEAIASAARIDNRILTHATRAECC